MTEPFNVGLIGCGCISDIYLENLSRFKGMNVIACASLDRQLLASGSLSLHLLDSSFVDITTDCAQPEPLSTTFPDPGYFTA